MSYNPPIIRLELDHMKQTMLIALQDYNSEITQQVQEQLDQAVREFDFHAQVRRIAYEVIRDAIESYFKYGNGRAIISKAVDASLDDVFSQINKGSE